VIGIQTDKLFQEETFNSYSSLQRALKRINGVEDIISVPSAVDLIKDSTTERLKAQPIFRDTTLSQAEIDSSKNIFLRLPFYRTLLYSPGADAWLMGVRINKNVMNSQKRIGVVEAITSQANDFGKSNDLQI